MMNTAPAPAPTTPPDGVARREPPEKTERESIAGEEDPGAGSDVPASDASPAADAPAADTTTQPRERR